jgi:hypothetical protein
MSAIGHRRRDVPLGIVYATDAKIEPGVKVAAAAHGSNQRQHAGWPQRRYVFSFPNDLAATVCNTPSTVSDPSAPSSGGAVALSAL